MAFNNTSFLPRIDTAVSIPGGETGQPISATHSDCSPRGLPERRRLRSVNTSPSLTRTRSDNTQKLLRSATEAVADALGVDANDLPQPFEGMTAMRNDSYSSSFLSEPHQDLRPISGLRQIRYDSTSSVSVYSPPLESDDWRKTMGDSIQKRLTLAVADVLGMDGRIIPLEESFVELGGNQRMARELRANCATAGMAISTRDIMNCKTIAELETCITPLSPDELAKLRGAPSIVSPMDPSSPEYAMRNVKRQKSEQATPPPVPAKALAGTNSLTRVPRKASRRHHNDVEQLLTLHGDVSGASVLRPKAGLFEGHVVALITLASCVVQGPDDCEIRLQNAYYTSQLPTIRDAIESRVSPKFAPTVWIVLEKMPLNEKGENDRRKLQTWIQNANDELYRQITSVQSQDEPRQPTTALERRIAKAVSKVLRVELTAIDMNMSFRGLGGDPDTAAQLVEMCRSQAISIHRDDILQASSLALLATLATAGQTHSRNASETATEIFELSAMQRLYFHTPMGSDSSQRASTSSDYRFNQSILLRLKRSIGTEEVRAAVEAVVGRHPMLRCHFRPTTGSWCQSVLPDISTSYHFAHHAVGTNSEIEDAVSAAQTAINIEQGPVFAAHLFQAQDASQMLYLVAHHLVVDLKSWRVIADDLEGVLTKGHLVSGRSLSFKEWTLQQRRHVQNTRGANSLPFAVPPPHCEYWGISPAASNTYGDTAVAGFSLGNDITAMLEATNNELKADSCDVFMAALLLSFSQTFQDRPVPALWNQEHERNALDTERDISDTVGWFTSLCPLAVDVFPTDDIFAILSRVKDARQATVERGLPYFTDNLIDGPSADSFAASYCPLELIFTYAGVMQNLESQGGLLEQLPIPGRALASKTSDIGRSVGRIAVFEVSVLIDNGDAKFKFLYHRESRHEQVQDWMLRYEKLLRQCITRLRYHTPGLSLSDVPYLDATFEGLEQFNKDIIPSLNLNVANIEAIYPVTANQQNVLINQLLMPGSSNTQMIYELNTVGTSVDIRRICAAWQQVTENHPSMRTVFSPSISQNGLYDQIVLCHHSPSMLFLEGESIDSSMAAIDNLPPLPLTEGIPWHRLIVCQSMGKTLLKLEVDQAICDVASLVILFSELEQAYFDGEAPPSFEVSYAEYIQCLKMTPCSVEYWKDRLHDARPCRFPSLASRSAAQPEWHTTSVDLQIPCQRLQSFANGSKVDLSTVLRVAWGLLLRTYLGSDDVCFGYRTSGRDIPVKGLGSAVGPFSTVLPCRIRILSTESVSRVLLRVEDQRMAALHHQHVPVSKIQHELQTKGDRLFNTSLSFGYEEVSNYSLADARFHHTHSRQASEYDMNADVNFHNGNVTIELGSRILTSDQANTVALAFGRAIETILEAPSGIVKETDLFSVHDHKQILAWNSMPQIDVPKDHVHQLIATQAIRNPDIQAVCAWDGDFTYGELHRVSTVLAKHLLATGLKPQTPLPVIFDKSRWAIVAMLAALTAGAIIVPVDVETNATFLPVVEAMSPDVVLVSDTVRKYVDSLGRKVVVVNEKTVAAMSAQAVEMTTPRTNPYDIACILLTYGNSKNHKSLSYSHGALATACSGQGPTLRINPSSRVMQLSSYSVDVALSEVFTTLVSGGCVCVPSSAERITGFSAAARRMKVNWTYLTPTLSRKLQPESLPDLAVVCFRARQLDSDAYAPWAGKAKVLLAYGSAEACPLGLSATEVTDSAASQSFGNPFCGNFWIVSPEDNNRLMPVGAVGELVIGGPTLASGFDIGEQDVRTWVGKSAARAKSLLDQSGSRLLKTGHMVRYREHGHIEFVTAEGEECAIDGKSFRVSDVEPKLRRCLGRNVDVVVETIAFNDSSSTPILAAFVEFGDALHGKEDLLRLGRLTKEKLYLSKKMADMVLRETLPSHMLPSAYVPVRSMPLTPSLKVNRRELQRLIAGLSHKQLLGLAQVPNPQEVQAASLKPLPLTRVEQQMRAIWADVLKIQQAFITANDGFLGLGGDAVTGHELVIACRRRGIAISITDVLRNLSLTEMCRGVAAIREPEVYVSQANTDTGASQQTEDVVQETRLPSRNEEAETDCVEPVPANAFMDEAITPQIGSDESMIEDVAEATSLQTAFIESGMLQSRGNVTYFLVNMAGSLDWQKLEHACFMLTRAHPILRTSFVSHSRQVYQTVLRSYRPDFLRYQCQGWRLGNLATKLVKREQPLAVDFRRPVTKFFYLDAGKSSILVIRLSRAQYDELSIPMLMRDLGRFYSRGDRLTRSPGFCEVVRAAQAANFNGASTDYWRGLLEGALPTQLVSQPSLTSADTNARTLHQQIPTGSLQNLGIPFETILKGAWSIVLSNLSGTTDVVFGQLVKGKHLTLPNGQAVADVVGPTGNVIPVRTRLPDIPITPYEYFRCVQSQHVASIPHENMQTADIVQQCTPWPAWTRLSTVVHHQNQSEQGGLMDFTIGSASCKLSLMESNHQDSDVFVRTAMAGSDNVDISVTFCENRMQLFFADELLKMLCSTISVLTATFVMEPMLLKGLNDSYSTPRIPLPAPKRDAAISSSVQSVDPDHARAVHTIISAAWDSVLEPQSVKAKITDIRSTPFFDIWPSLMPAAELARYYTQKVPRMPGLEEKLYTMEEIIEHPTMMQQYELIIAKQQSPQLKHSRSRIMMRTPSSWGKNFRKLTIGTGPAPSNGIASSSLTVPAQKHKTPISGRSSSLESLTAGSSNSDDDDDDLLKEGARTPPTPPYVGHGNRSPALIKRSPVKSHRKASSLLGKMMHGPSA
ncbi:Uu.00g062110.m01.CDS01 [Anthostomella pinea]|uniref:Uu.00g062110.m01.CDS01 n=1 Tax=Anthostomella pinea TaxID=933095 RepID=A0AAI8VMJ0_9PEZI|nr:Uu.00g062110.m01.CDS01 [Anthostomella pinea]